MTISRPTTRDIARCGLFAALIAAGAFVTVPLGPVPFTLQVFAVLLAGLALGPRLGALSVTAYLALGLVAPVYAGGTAGVGILLGPTGGYLIGFPVAAVLTGLCAGSGPMSPGRLVSAALVGLVPIYVLGPAWLAVQLDLGVGGALSAGVAPFVVGDVVKALLAAGVARGLVRLPLGLPATQRDR